MEDWGILIDSDLSNLECKIRKVFTADFQASLFTQLLAKEYHLFMFSISFLALRFSHFFKKTYLERIILPYNNTETDSIFAHVISIYLDLKSSKSCEPYSFQIKRIFAKIKASCPRIFFFWKKKVKDATLQSKWIGLFF